jgi:hypothetical protein
MNNEPLSLLADGHFQRLSVPMQNYVHIYEYIAPAFFAAASGVFSLPSAAAAFSLPSAAVFPLPSAAGLSMSSTAVFPLPSAAVFCLPSEICCLIPVEVWENTGRVSFVSFYVPHT